MRAETWFVTDEVVWSTNLSSAFCVIDVTYGERMSKAPGAIRVVTYRGVQMKRRIRMLDKLLEDLPVSANNLRGTSSCHRAKGFKRVYRVCVLTVT